MLELFAAMLLGILVGTFTGLMPGIHINLIATLLISSIVSFQTSFFALSVFIIAMSITHTFLDFIPTIFLGAPEEDSFLAVLPGHQLLQEGRGYEAAILALLGSLAALPILLLIAPLFFLALPYIFQPLKILFPYLLIVLSCYIILRDTKPLQAAIVFLLAGFLGLATFQLPIKNPLMPLLTGLFGLSSLFLSLKTPSFRKQEILPLKHLLLSKQQTAKATLAALFAAPLCSFLPGIGSGHAATFGSEIIPQTRKSFLFLTGAISTLIMALSIVTLYTLNITRSGSAAALHTLLPTPTSSQLLILFSTILLTGSIAFFIGILCARIFARSLNSINYTTLSKGVIVLLIFLTLLFSNTLGFLVLITATALGIFCALSQTKKINLMAALIVPAAVFYLMH